MFNRFDEVHEEGLEPPRLSAPEPKDEAAPSDSPSCENHDDVVNGRRQSEVAPGHSRGTTDAVEDALANGVHAAAEALRRGEPGALDTMRALAAELEARRKARANVVELDAERSKRGRR